MDFTSNDYLGLAGAPRLKAATSAAIERGVPAGAGGSRLLRGNHAEHQALESGGGGLLPCRKGAISAADLQECCAVLVPVAGHGPDRS